MVRFLRFHSSRSRSGSGVRLGLEVIAPIVRAIGWHRISIQAGRCYGGTHGTRSGRAPCRRADLSGRREHERRRDAATRARCRKQASRTLRDERTSSPEHAARCDVARSRPGARAYAAKKIRAAPTRGDDHASGSGGCRPRAHRRRRLSRRRDAPRSLSSRTLMRPLLGNRPARPHQGRDLFRSLTGIIGRRARPCLQGYPRSSSARGAPRRRGAQRPRTRRQRPAS